MPAAWLLTLTPETRVWVEAMPEDVLTHPLLRVVLSERGPMVLNDVNRADVVGQVRHRIRALELSRVA